jgi:hypothetical protein
MYLLKRLAQGAAIAVPLVLFNGCFPTEATEEQKDNPLEPDTSFTINDDPEDLPTDISTTANTSDAGIDSMFNLLVSRVQEMENVNTAQDVYAVDFTSLRRGFGAAVNKTPAHVKANAGFIVSSVLSINADRDLQKVIDSMDVYINDMDAYFSSGSESEVLPAKRTTAKKAALPASRFLAKTFASHGVITTGQALFAETPKILMAQTNRPSFPRFITASYIQNLIETGVVPRLNEVIAATQRLRAQNQMSLLVTIDGEQWEIDRGDICILEGMTRAARAGFTMMCVYDYDLYTSNGVNDMRWIDSYAEAIKNVNYFNVETYSLSGDTLIRSWYYDATQALAPYMDMYRYNISRTGFLGIRRNFHTAVYSDLKEVPVLLKAGLAAINSETDNQDDDLIPSTDIFDMTSEMGEFSQEMLDEGFSTALASKFRSPEALLDFISSILANPYVFDETIEGRHVKITVDLSKFFTNPAPALSNYWPKFIIPSGNDRYATYTSDPYVNTTTSNVIYVYTSEDDSVRMDIPASMIDSVSGSTWDVGTKIYYLKNSYRYVKDVSTTRTDIGIQLVDDKGAPINFYDALYRNEFTRQTLAGIFPYFNDYTFRGIFPDMKTRQNWVDFFSVFID